MGGGVAVSATAAPSGVSAHGGRALAVRFKGRMTHCEAAGGVSAWQERGSDLANL